MGQLNRPSPFHPREVRQRYGIAISVARARSSVRTTADIYSHAIRGKDHAAALCWDDIMQRAHAEKPRA